MNKKIQGCIIASFLAVVATVGGMVATGCGGGGRTYACTQSIEPALVVYVTDAATGQPAAANATVIVTDGDFTETLRVGVTNVAPDGSDIPLAFSGPPERAGTYSVRVSRAGYADAEKTGIRVTEGPCHVNTQELTVALTPLAQPATQ